MADRAEHIFSLGPWVRRRRKALDLTQAALARRVGCAEVTIRKLEADVIRPSRTIAERLVRCLDLDPSDRAMFLQVASGERSVTCLTTPNSGIEMLPLGTALAVPAVVRLPLDAVPDPAPLPAGSYMQLRRNPLFVGREHDLRQLAYVLSGAGTAAIAQQEIAAATGLGGIGKTQLACEFVHRYGQFFTGGVFWLSFADPAAIRAEVAACGGVGGMQLSPEFGSLPLDEQVRQVQRAWKRPTPRLLIFDNCEDVALLDQWQPQHGGCRVLITSRRQHWDAALGVQSVPLDVLPRQESIALLRTFRPDLPNDSTELDAIAATLGDLPLALYLAGSFLAKYRHALTPAHYLQRLSTSTILDDHSLREAGLSPTRHVQHVARTFEQSYERLDVLDPIDALARTLLARAAYFAPGELLPRCLLLKTLDLPEDDVDHALLAEDALIRLMDLGLLEPDTAGNLRLHRLLVAFVRTVLGHNAAQAVVEATIMRVVNALNDQQSPRPLLPTQPHLRFITEASQPRADASTAGLCHALGVHLRLLGLYGEGQSYLEQAVMLRTRVLGVDHADTANSLNHLSAVLWAQGHYRTAQDYMEQVLAIRQRVLGPDHPDVAVSFNNLGIVLDAQGCYAEAQGYYEQALAIWQRVLGPDHPDTAHSLNNLGGLLISLERHAEAQGYFEQALVIRQRVLGTDHPDTAHSLNNLGEALQGQGRYAEAQGYYEQALAIWQRVLGADHPDTAHSFNNLGQILCTQGCYAEAQSYHEQALAIRERVLGTDHPDTATSLHNLGVVLQNQGDVQGVRDYFGRALAIFERRLGPKHPATQAALAALDALEQRNRASSG